MNYPVMISTFLTTLLFSSQLDAALSDTTQQKDSSPGGDEQATVSQIWLNTVWKNIDEVTAEKASFDVEKVTTVAGVRGAEAEDEASSHLYYRQSMGSPSREELWVAIKRLEGMIEKEATGERLPEFKYYVIQCYSQLGNQDKVRELQEKLIREHPDSKWAAIYKK